MFGRFHTATDRVQDTMRGGDYVVIEPERQRIGNSKSTDKDS